MKRMKIAPKKQGFIMTIVIIVIAVILLNYLGFNFHDFLTSTKSQSVLEGIWNFVVNGWNKYLAQPFFTFWNKFVIGIVWETIKHILGGTKS